MSAVMNTYARYPLTLVKGRGSRVWDDAGREYLDFVSGIAVNSLGHAHPELAKTICDQANTMLHCSNLFRIQEQEALAEKLCILSGLDAAFFCNSGAEANEAAFKLSRKFWYDRGSKRRNIICAANSFHGRTLNTLTATGQDKVKIGYDPLPPGFLHVPYGDMNALQEVVDSTTAAILLEPIQGEGGVNLPPDGYLKYVRNLCDDHGILLVLDEVQTGIGRTGRMFAFEHSGIKPDILTLAKGMGGGVAIGTMLASAKLAKSFGPGTHGSTFGGNPLACRAAAAVLSVIEAEDLLANTIEQGKRLICGLKNIRKKESKIRDIRGLGLLTGVELGCEVTSVISSCRDKGLLLLPAGPKVLRILPPLNVSSAEVEEALGILADCLHEVSI
ncbi:MAG: acetylornithine transaminase [Mariprofundaceae bacterium]